MSIFTLPATITVTNPINSSWSTLTRSDDPSIDTSTEIHYEVGTIKFKFVDTNGVVSFDVNNIGTGDGGSPSEVSKIGLNGSDGGDSVTVSHGDIVYFYNTGATSLHGQFTIPSSGWWSTSGGTGTESFDPVIENVVFTKTSDTTVSTTFDWSNLATFNLVKNGTATAVTPPTPLGSSHTFTTTVAHNDVLYIEYTDIDGFVVQAGLKYTHQMVQWSIGLVNGVKSVIAKFYGIDSGYHIGGEYYLRWIDNSGQTDDDFNGKVQSTQGNSLITLSVDKINNVTFQVVQYSASYQSTHGTYYMDYGPEFKTRGGKVSSNFW